MAAAALPALRKAGVLAAEVECWLRKEEVGTLNGLAACFMSLKHIQDEAPYMLEAWSCARGQKPEVWRGAAELREHLRKLEQASRAIAEDAPARYQPASAKQKANKARAVKRTGKPRPQPVQSVLMKDDATRKKAAKAAVELSLQWAPAAGVAKGLQPSDPLIPMVRNVHEGRIANFEAKGVWGALNQWKKWEAHMAEHSKHGSEGEQRILLASSVTSRPAATGPLAAWNRFDWTVRHLHADLSMTGISKPAKKGDADGAIRKS